jgi:hypothetical protein
MPLQKEAGFKNAVEASTPEPTRVSGSLVIHKKIM